MCQTPFVEELVLNTFTSPFSSFVEPHAPSLNDKDFHKSTILLIYP